MLSPKPWLQGFEVNINTLPPFSNNESIPVFITAPVGVLIWFNVFFFSLFSFSLFEYLFSINKFIFSNNFSNSSLFFFTFKNNLEGEIGQKGLFNSASIDILISFFSQ